jgi:hypothetical protein
LTPVLGWFYLPAIDGGIDATSDSEHHLVSVRSQLSTAIDYGDRRGTIRVSVWSGHTRWVS